MSDTETTTDETADAVSAPTNAAAPVSSTRVKIVSLWLSEASKLRLETSFECDITDELESTSKPDMIIISTRIPKIRLSRVMASIAEAGSTQVAVVCHAGGEAAAIELMAYGAACIVAEGNEGVLHRLVPTAQLIESDEEVEEDESTNDEGLVTTLAQRLDSSSSGSRGARGLDEITGLPGSSAFELRFAEASQRDPLPRLGFIRLSNPEHTFEGLDQETIDLLRRRIATMFNSVARRYDIELFSLNDRDYSFLGRELSVTKAEDFGLQIVQMGECFSPTGQDVIRMAVGHAGPEVASEPRTLRDLAERAVDGAIAQQGGVISADDLSRSQASSTELEAALRLAKKVDELDPYTNGHSHRVADYAAEIAQELGIEGHDLLRLRLSCLLHDIGKVGLPPEALMESTDLEGEDVKSYEEHANRGYRYASLSAGDEVALAIRHHHERWDGDGFPDALLKEDIPIFSRIIAVADAYDRWTCSRKDPAGPRPPSTDEVVASLLEESENAYDPLVVDAAINLFAGGA